jgi:methionyl-tRNA synthetase
VAKRKKKAAKKTTAKKKTANEAGKKLARGAGKAKAAKTKKTPAKNVTKKDTKKALKKAPKKAAKKAHKKPQKKAAKPEEPAKLSATRGAGGIAKPPLAAKKDAGKTSKQTFNVKKAPQATRSIEPIPAPPVVAKAPGNKPKKKRVEKKAAEPKAAPQPAHEEVQEIPVPVAPAPALPKTNTFYITTAIAYPNGTPHIGHAYEAIATDALARFQRLDGKDVFFLTGTDEHGLKMIQTAASEGMTPEALAARNAGRFRDMDERLNISFNRFIRTSEPAHHRSVQMIWDRMQQAGDIYIDTYSGWYSVRDEAYYAEEEVALGEDDVRRGPQGSPVEWVEEKSYFFKLSAYQDRLLAHYNEHPDFIGPDSRRNEVMSFVKGGLRDLSISRTTFDWGVKVPNDLDHVMYVWVDALTNYITGVGFPDESDPNWRYWPANVHIIGKDIIRFHAVYWPAFLMSAGVALPKRVYAHGFLFNRGEKMSKSVGNVVDPFNLADQYGVDQMRYFFLREVPFGQDGSYNHEAIVARINADLANDLGNLAQRSLSMIAKQLDGVLPEPGAFSDIDNAILAQADGMIAIAREAMATQQIHQWLNAVWAVVAEANRYFAGEAPWALAKTDPARQQTVLYVTAEVVRQIAILTQPAMPVASVKLLDSLGIPRHERVFAMLGGATRIAPGTQLPAPVAVFPRYVEATVG